MKNRYLAGFILAVVALGIYRHLNKVAPVAPIAVQQKQSQSKAPPEASPPAASTTISNSNETVLQEETKNWCQFRGPTNELVLPKNVLKLLWHRKHSYFVFSQKDIPCLEQGTHRVLFYEVNDRREVPTHFVLEAEIEVEKNEVFPSFEALNEFVNKSALHLNLDKTVSEFSNPFPSFTNRPPLVLSKVALVKKSWAMEDFGVSPKSPFYKTLESEPDFKKFLSAHPKSNLIYLTSLDDTKLSSSNHSLYLNVPDVFHVVHINEDRRNTPDYKNVISQLNIDEPVILIGENAGDRAVEVVSSVFYQKNIKPLYIFRPGVAGLNGTAWHASMSDDIKMLKFRDLRRLYAKGNAQPTLVDVRPISRVEYYNIGDAITFDDFKKESKPGYYIFIGASDYDPSVKQAITEIPSDKISSVAGYLRGGYEELSLKLWLSRLGPPQKANKKKDAGLKKLRKMKYVGASSGAMNRRLGIKLTRAEKRQLKKKGLRKKNANQSPGFI